MNDENMAVALADVPSALERPEGAPKSPIRALMTKEVFGRRSFIRGAFAGGMALGLASLDLLPTGPRASAAPATWYHCEAYSAWDNGYWNICNPCANGHPPISNYYCNSNGYHRIDTVYEGSGVTTEFFRRHQTCYNKNAWVWHISDNNRLPNPRDRRCSDGRFRTERYGSLLSKGPTVCQKLLAATGTVQDNRTVSC